MTSPTTTGVIRGTVAYRQRMALLPGSTVEVTLADVSRQDAPAPTIASTAVDPAGRQVPIPFELAYDPDRIDPAHTYAVRATIRHEGRLMFSTDTAMHVITRGNPTDVALMLVAVPHQASAAPQASLAGTSWVLTEIDGHAVEQGTRPTSSSRKRVAPPGTAPATTSSRQSRSPATPSPSGPGLDDDGLRRASLAQGAATSGPRPAQRFTRDGATSSSTSRTPATPALRAVIDVRTIEEIQRNEGTKNSFDNLLSVPLSLCIS
jgi:uncharacterized lipoprotein YbaY